MNIVINVVWWFRENWGKLLGYPIIALGLIALAFVFPWILIFYLFALGGWLTSDR